MIVIGVKTLNTKQIEEALKKVLSDKGIELEFKILKPLTYLNEGWTAVSITDKDDLILLKITHVFEDLSGILHTGVLAFEDIDVVSSYSIFNYMDGKLLDELQTTDFAIFEKYGFFNFLEDELEDFDDLKLDDFFAQVGFEPRTADILDQV